MVLSRPEGWRPPLGLSASEPSMKKPGSQKPDRGAHSSLAILDMLQLLREDFNSCRGPAQPQLKTYFSYQHPSLYQS